jgi:hypothetical protein
VTPYKNQNQEKCNSANGPAAYCEDNRIPAGRDLNGWLITMRFRLRFLFPSTSWLIQTQRIQSGGVVDYGPALDRSSAQNAAGNDVEASVPDGEPCAPSECLRSLTKCYVLDPGTRIETVDIGTNRYGRRKIIIALETANSV